MFTKVERQKAKARIALTGVSGAGKTVSALLLAYGITEDWNKVAVIDTEHERARFYANREDLGIGEFLYCPVCPPYTPDKYIQAVKEGYKHVGSDGVVIIDSLSHAWNGEGGVLSIRDTIAKRSGQNSFTAWNEAGNYQNRLIDSILSLDCHTIITLRVKMEYSLQTDEKGKTKPVKLGLAPVQREDTEYEFDIVLSIGRDHTATASKDTTFLDDFNGVITPELGKELKKWLNEGKEPEHCETCGAVIRSAKGLLANQIIERSQKTYGKKLCMDCCVEEAKLLKEQQEQEQQKGAK